MNLYTYLYKQIRGPLPKSLNRIDYYLTYNISIIGKCANAPYKIRLVEITTHPAERVLSNIVYSIGDRVQIPYIEPSIE